MGKVLKFQVQTLKIGLLVCFLIAGGLIARSASPIKYSLNDIEYELNKNTKTAVVKKFDRHAVNVEIPRYVDYEGSQYKVTEFERWSFANTSILERIVIPNTIEEIPEGAFSYCSYLKEVVLPNSIKTIGDNAFSNCTSLKTFTIPMGLTEIPAGIFAYCRQLEKVRIPSTVIKIRHNAFGNCSSLKSIALPPRVMMVESYALGYCENLEDVYCWAQNPPLCEYHAFQGSYPDLMTLHVPRGKAEEYRNADGWKNFGKIVDDLVNQR